MSDDQKASGPDRRVGPRPIEALRLLIGENLVYFSGTAIAAAGKFGTAILVARSVGPEDYAPWNILSLILTYGAFVTFGVPTGARRELPYQLGRRDAARTREVVGAGWVFSLLPGLLLTAFLPLLAGAVSLPSILLFATGLALVATHVRIFVYSILQASVRFTAVGALQAVYGLSTFAVALILVDDLGLLSLPLSIALGSVLSASLGTVTAHPRPVWTRDPGLYKHLAGIGLPLVAASLLFGLVTSIDRFFILGYLSTVDLGLYTPAIFVFGGLSMVREIISEQIYPRMSFVFGREDDAVAQLAELVRAENRTAQLLLFLGGAALLFVLEPGIALILPDYIEGVRAAQYLTLGVMALSLSGGYADLLAAIGRQKLYLIMQGATLVLNVILIWLALQVAPSLDAIALADALSFLVYSIGLVYIGEHELRRLSERPAPTR